MSLPIVKYLTTTVTQFQLQMLSLFFYLFDATRFLSSLGPGFVLVFNLHKLTLLMATFIWKFPKPTQRNLPACMIFMVSLKSTMPAFSLAVVKPTFENY